MISSGDTMLRVHPFPWGTELVPFEGKKGKGMLDVAMVHQFVWKGKPSFPGAPAEGNVGKWKQRVKGYDVVLVGDNHQGFTAKCGDCTIYNCGTFIRRHANEIETKPAVGLVYDDGTVKRRFLDVSRDKFSTTMKVDREVQHNPELVEFLDELDNLDLDQIDYCEQLRLAAGQAEEDVRNTLLEILEQDK